MLARPRDTQTLKKSESKRDNRAKKRILNVFWFHFVFLSFYFCFSKVSHQPNRQERLNLPTALNVQRINVGGKPKIQGRSSLRHYTTRSHVHIWFHFASFIRSLVHFFSHPYIYFIYFSLNSKVFLLFVFAYDRKHRFKTFENVCSVHDEVGTCTDTIRSEQPRNKVKRNINFSFSTKLVWREFCQQIRMNNNKKKQAKM